MTTQSSLDEVVARTRGNGLGGKFAATLDVVLGRVSKRMDRDERDDSLMRLIVPVPITAPQIPLAAGAGKLDSSVAGQTLGPNTGFAWDVRKLNATGFTAGTVTAYRNLVGDENIEAVWTVAGAFTFSGGIILVDSDDLIFVAAGITGTVTISGWAINIPTPLLPEYLI